MGRSLKISARRVRHRVTDDVGLAAHFNLQHHIGLLLAAANYLHVLLEMVYK